jgi:hypothetical protein
MHAGYRRNRASASPLALRAIQGIRFANTGCGYEPVLSVLCFAQRLQRSSPRPQGTLSASSWVFGYLSTTQDAGHVSPTISAESEQRRPRGAITHDDPLVRRDHDVQRCARRSRAIRHGVHRLVRTPDRSRGCSPRSWCRSNRSAAAISHAAPRRLAASLLVSPTPKRAPSPLASVPPPFEHLRAPAWRITQRPSGRSPTNAYGRVPPHPRKYAPILPKL